MPLRLPGMQPSRDRRTWCPSPLMPADLPRAGQVRQRMSNSAINGQHVSNVPQAASVPQPSAPATHNQQPGKQNETKPHEVSKSNPGTASARVPQPPAGNSYHAAPAYTASSYAGASSSYPRSGRSYSSQASAYGSSRSAYSPPATSSRSAGTYSAAPAYSVRATAPVVPHYSAPAAPHYSAPSAPHYSGGGGGGGGASHASSGHSGGHSR